MSKLPLDVKNSIRVMFLDGIPSRIIADKLGLSQKMVLRYIGSTLTSKWSDAEIQILTKEWQNLPSKYANTVQMNNLCLRLNRTKSSIISMAFQIGLTKNITSDRSIVNKNDKEEKLIYERPKAIYTNISTPYGIADEIHKGERTFVEQCKY